MDDEEMKQFVSNWKAIVAQEAVGYFENDDSQKSTVESFIHLFDHYFGNRIREMLTEEQQEAQYQYIEFASVSNNQPGQVGSDQTQKRKSDPEIKSPEKRGKEDD